MKLLQLQELKILETPSTCIHIVYIYILCILVHVATTNAGPFKIEKEKQTSKRKAYLPVEIFKL